MQINPDLSHTILAHNANFGKSIFLPLLIIVAFGFLVSVFFLHFKQCDNIVLYCLYIYINRVKVTVNIVKIKINLVLISFYIISHFSVFNHFINFYLFTIFYQFIFFYISSLTFYHFNIFF